MTTSSAVDRLQRHAGRGSTCGGPGSLLAGSVADYGGSDGSRIGTRRASATARDPAITQLVMAVLGAVLVVAGLVELLLDGWMWLYPVHIGAGILALLAAPFRRLAKPAALLLGALFLFLYVFEAANPAGADDVARPSSNATLILTGVVVVAVMVALMWPNTYSGRASKDGRNHE